MKLIVQIPCLNEEDTLPLTVADIPRQIDGIDEIEVLVVNDGSTDRTVEVARMCGVDHIVSHKTNLGLAAAFRTGLEASIALGADVIINTDGDNQYEGTDMPRLLEPILKGRADMVIGDRRPSINPHFSPVKKVLQRFGSCVVRMASGSNVPDAVSGFRAFTREAALQLTVMFSFSYTIETIIQARHKQLVIAWVPISTNPRTRDSRLFRSIPQFLIRSGATLVRSYAMYHPLRLFLLIGITLATLGAIPIGRFFYLYWLGSGSGHIQSLVLGGVLLSMGFAASLAALFGDLIATNRKLLENTLEKVRRLECEGGRTMLSRSIRSAVPGAAPQLDLWYAHSQFPEAE